MKIALFVHEFPKLSETFILNQIDGLMARGHEVTIFPCQRGEESRSHEIVARRGLMDFTRFPRNMPRSRIGKIRSRMRALVLSLKDRHKVLRLKDAFSEYEHIGNWRLALLRAEPLILEGGKFDVIFAHFGPNGLRASWYRDAGLIEGPLVTVFHGFDLSSQLKEIGTKVYGPLFHKGDLFLPISQFWKDRLLALGCPEQKIRVHHVGIDCEHFSFQPRSVDQDEPLILISVARLVEKKGIEYAIKALATLVSEGRNIRYRIVGNGPLLEQLRVLVSDMNLQEHVSFLGTRTSSEVVSDLNRAHIFLAPSVTSHSGDMEGIPTVLMEAMATGMPVISTLHSGIPELVEDGVSGRLVPERDVEALGTAISGVWDDAGHWVSMGQAGRGKVLEEFNIRTLNSQLESLFEGLGA